MAKRRGPARTPFEEFFEDQFLPALEEVESEPVFTSGRCIQDASWDRKAAYLLYLELGGDDA